MLVYLVCDMIGLIGSIYSASGCFGFAGDYSFLYVLTGDSTFVDMLGLR